MNELMECIEELQKNHTGSEIAQALREYIQLVEDIAKDYTNDTTVKELREEHPELSFMDDEEIEELLANAKERRQEMLEEIPDPSQIAPPIFKKGKNKYLLFKVKKDGTCHSIGKFESNMKPSKLLKEFRLYIKWRERKEIDKLFSKTSIKL